MSYTPFPGDANWKDVPIWAGGFSIQIDITDDIIICCDTTGPFIWEAAQCSWRPMLTASSMPTTGASGPIPYCGQYQFAGHCCVKAGPGPCANIYYFDLKNSYMLLSQDRGYTWTALTNCPPMGTPTIAETSISGAYRMYGPRSAVDKTTPTNFYLALSTRGLYMTFNTGGSWTPVPSSSVPPSLNIGTLTNPIGYPMLVVCPDGTGDLYVTSYQTSAPQLYKSLSVSDTSTWTPVTASGPAAGSIFQSAAQGPGCIYYVTLSPTGYSELWQFNIANHVDGWTRLRQESGNLQFQTVAYAPNPFNVLAIGGAGGSVQASYGTPPGAVWTPGSTGMVATPRTGGDILYLDVISAPPQDGYLDIGQMAFDSSGTLHTAAGWAHWISNVLIPNQTCGGTWPTNIGWRGQGLGSKQIDAASIATYPGQQPIVGVDDLFAFYLQDLVNQPNQLNQSSFCPGLQVEWARDGSLVFILAEPAYGVGSPQTCYSLTGGAGPALGLPGSPWTLLAQTNKPPNPADNGTYAKQGGAVAISTKDNWVWQTRYNPNPPLSQTAIGPYYTTDGTSNPNTWNACSFYAGGTSITPTWGTNTGVLSYSSTTQQTGLLQSDGATAGTFYYYMPTLRGTLTVAPYTGIYASTNGGMTFNQTYHGIPDTPSPLGVYQGAYPKIVCPLGKANDIWFTGGFSFGLAAPTNGNNAVLTDSTTNLSQKTYLMHSTDGGYTWAHIPNVNQAICFGFGPQAPWGTYPTIFIVGWVNYNPSLTYWTYGLHVSYNEGVTWTQLARYPNNQIGLPLWISGDWNIGGAWNPSSYTRCYVGFSGNGFVYHP